MKKVKYVDLITEGVFTLRMKMTDFHKFKLFGVAETYVYNEEKGGISTSKTALQGMFCVIKKEANVKSKWLEYVDKETSSYLMKPFNHIKIHPDFTSVELIYDDGNIEHISLPFVGTTHENYDSKLQRCACTETGDLIVEIRESENAESIFDEWWFNCYPFEVEEDPDLKEVEEFFDKQSIKHQLTERRKNDKNIGGETNDFG